MTIDAESNLICILPYNKTENPPSLYEILVYDITREKIFEAYIAPNDSMISGDCVTVRNSLTEYSSTCTPLLVFATAYNEFGEMDTLTSIYSENDTITGDVCSCINETGKKIMIPFA